MVKKINANKLNDCNVYITTKRILFLYEVEASVMDEGLIYTLDFIKYCIINVLMLLLLIGILGIIGYLVFSPIYSFLLWRFKTVI